MTPSFMRKDAEELVPVNVVTGLLTEIMQTFEISYILFYHLCISFGPMFVIFRNGALPNTYPFCTIHYQFLSIHYQINSNLFDTLVIITLNSSY